MAAERHDARLRFLEDASAAMFASPAVSSWLQHTRTVVSMESGRPTRSQLDCSGCSRLMLPGYSCDVLKIPRTRKDRLGGKPKARRCRCTACGTVNDLPAEKARPIRQPAARSRSIEKIEARGPSSQSIPAQPSTSVVRSTPHTTTEPSLPQAFQAPTQASGPSKKRGRGKNSSLQALLANKKPESPKKTGFDFMDFLKS